MKTKDRGNLERGDGRGIWSGTGYTWEDSNALAIFPILSWVVDMQLFVLFVTPHI